MNVRKLILSTIAALTALPALSALAEELGTKVSIRAAKGSLPDPQQVVEALESPGGEHQVRATLRNLEGQEELTLELWGSWMPNTKIPDALREGFPGLFSAEIQVTSLDAAERPKLDPDDALEVTKDVNHKKKIVKRIEKK